MCRRGVEKRVAGAAARGGQHFELGTVSDASKAACAEQRAAGKTSKKARRLEKAAEKAKAPKPPKNMDYEQTWDMMSTNSFLVFSESITI